MKNIDKILENELQNIRDSGLYKSEHEIESSQSSMITVKGKNVINFCANNYLGLSNHPLMVEAAKSALDKWGFGLSSVRFICGTQNIHKELESKISTFLSKEDIQGGGLEFCDYKTTVPFKNNSCILFPSRVYHKTESFTSQTERYSIAQFMNIRYYTDRNGGH